MNAGQLAALIAAAFFAVGVCAAVYVLVKVARLVTAATSLVTSYQASADDLLQRTRAVVERADEQLARTGALADGVDQVAASMSDLSEQVAAVAGTTRLIASGLGAPVLRLAAAGHGVRRAIAIRGPAAQSLNFVPTAGRRRSGPGGRSLTGSGPSGRWPTRHGPIEPWRIGRADDRAADLAGNRRGSRHYRLPAGAEGSEVAAARRRPAGSARSSAGRLRARAAGSGAHLGRGRRNGRVRPRCPCRDGRVHGPAPRHMNRHSAVQAIPS